MDRDLEKGFQIDVDAHQQDQQGHNAADDNKESPPATPTTISAKSAASGSSATPLVKKASCVNPWRFLRYFGRSAAAETQVSTRHRSTIVREIHSTPQGYPRLGAFLDSDENFMVYRRFGYIQSRLLLEKQNALQLLERQLNMMDSVDDEEDTMRLRTRRDYDEEHMQDRVQLLDQIGTEFTQYSTLLSAAQKLTSLNKPSAGEYRSVRNWMEGQNGVLDEDAEFIYQKEDLITLRPGREYAWLDSGVEHALRFFDWKFVRRMFQSEETRRKTDGSGKEVYYTRSRIERFVVTLITLMILLLLVLPIYVLYELSDRGEEKGGSSRRDLECIGVLLVFTLAFSACISLFTRARRHEILAASAAYCAVLVVFIGNLGNISITGA